MDLKLMTQDFSVCKLKDLNLVPFEDELFFLAKTDEEYSLVCETRSVPENNSVCENGWKAFRVEGQLDFAMIGIIAGIADLLKENSISIFVVSTYNTDYFMVKETHIGKAKEILEAEEYRFT